MNPANPHPFRSQQARQRYLRLYDQRASRWPVPAETRMIATSYGETFVRASGPPGAPPLVLLHGISGNSLQWMANIAALSASFRTYAVDTINDYGRSVASRPITTRDHLMGWLDELFDGLGLAGGINLMGLSYGGWLASQYALRSPRRLARLVLVAPVCTVLPLSAGWIWRAVLCAIPLRVFTRHFVAWMLTDLAASGPQGRALLEEWTDEAFLALRSFKRRPFVHPTVLSDAELRQLTVPALYLVGEHETIYAAGPALERLGRVAAQIRSVLIPGAGHDLTMVQAGLVNRTVLEFLRAPA